MEDRKEDRGRKGRDGRRNREVKGGTEEGRREAEERRKDGE